MGLTVGVRLAVRFDLVGLRVGFDLVGLMVDVRLVVAFK